MRPKKLYTKKDSLPAVGVKAAAASKVSKEPQQVERRSLEALAGAAGLTAAAAAARGRQQSLAQLSRKELQALAIKAGIKANQKNADLIKALTSMAST